VGDRIDGRIVMDAARKALHEAEIELGVMQEVRRLNPGYADGDGDTIDTLIGAQMDKIRGLKADLHGEC